MEVRMSTRAIKAVAFSILLFAASGLMLQSRGALASGPPKAAPLVRGISIHHAPDGAITINISLTKPVPYHTMQLAGPDRLVVDLKGAHQTDLKGEYPAQSAVLKGVRAGQWKYFPAVFRVVADLKGHPVSSIKAVGSGIQIKLKPRGEELAPNHGPGPRPAQQAAETVEAESRTAGEGPPPNKLFEVHRFKDLSASLTAPVLPPHDRLVPVAEPDVPVPVRKQVATLASVSGISIQPNARGETTIDIASSRSVPYRVFQLADPYRLVIDLKDARSATSQDVYQVDSPVLKSVRVGQWKSGGPAVVRVVADLQGYPIFDVHAQRPGIRIELKPRPGQPQAMRNPFQFQTSSQQPAVNSPASGLNQSQRAQTVSPATAPGNSILNLKLIGFIEKKDSGAQAVISDRTNVYLVPQGGTFGQVFTVLAIKPDAVMIQNMENQEKRWIAYTP